MTAPEDCDGADLRGVTCTDFGFDVGEVRCSSRCRYDVAACEHSFQSVDAGFYHTCGVKTDGTISCWGDNDSGRATPPTASFLQVSTSSQHTCAVKTDGTVACWGDQAR